MRFLDWFRRSPPIADADALAEFIDSQAAFLMQKGIYEYSRARSGHYAKVMFGEQLFIDAFNLARWQAYPLGLAMVGELVEGVLRDLAGANPRRSRAGCARWSYRCSTAILFLRRSARRLGAKPAASWHCGCSTPACIRPSEPWTSPNRLAKAYFDLMPIHEKLRGRDFPTTHNYLKVTMCNIHAELTQTHGRAGPVATLAGCRTGLRSRRLNSNFDRASCGVGQIAGGANAERP